MIYPVSCAAVAAGTYTPGQLRAAVRAARWRRVSPRPYRDPNPDHRGCSVRPSIEEMREGIDCARIAAAERDDPLIDRIIEVVDALVERAALR